MKTFNNLFPGVVSFDALHAGYMKARRGKRHTPEVLRFEGNLEGNLIQLQNELIWNEYSTGPYYTFCVHEPKTRLVAALPFRDRVVQHALVGQMEPIWEARFIEHSYACRVGKGMHAGADQAQKWLRDVTRHHGQAYAFKADVLKYFRSIDRHILYGLIERRIRCKRTLAVCRNILRSWAQGLPIGNLTSQLWANVYLHELDKFVKQTLRAKRYARYMDDFIIIHHDKSQLHAWRQQITAWLRDNLRLELNNKTQVFPVARSRGRALDFLGYRMWPNYRRLRPGSVHRMHRRMRYMQGQFARGEIDFSDIRQRIASWEGHARRAHSHGVRHQIFNNHPFARGES